MTIKDIEKVGHEFEIDPLGKQRVLENTRIPIEEAGAEQQVPRRIAIRERSWNYECSRVKPPVNGTIGNGRIARDIRATAWPAEDGAIEGDGVGFASAETRDTR